MVLLLSTSWVANVYSVPVNPEPEVPNNSKFQPDFYDKVLALQLNVTTNEMLNGSYQDQYHTTILLVDQFNSIHTVSDDKSIGGKDNDAINGGKGSDKLHGNHGADTINGGDDNDRIHGGWGNDTISGDAGSDVCNGGRGSDTIDSSCETIKPMPDEEDDDD